MQPWHVFVTRRIPPAALEALRSRAQVQVWDRDSVVPRDQLLQEARQADALLCMLTDRIDEELLIQAAKLKVVANMAVGVDNVDVAACTARGVLVTNTPGVLTHTTADLAFALLLASARRVVEADRFVRSGKWKTWSPTLMLGREVHGATLGIIGLGRIGTEVARRGRGFQMRLIYFSRTRRPDVERELGLTYVPLAQLLAQADFVSLHVDLNETTRHMLSREQFRLMKPEAHLVNTTRGTVVDQAALVEALRSGWIAGAGLDVTDPEPLPGGHELLKLPNVIVCPHIGSASVETRARMAMLAAENILAAIEGRLPPAAINPQASGRLERIERPGTTRQP